MTVLPVRYDSCWKIQFCQLSPIVSSPYRNFVLLLLFYWCRDFSQLHRFSIKFQPCKSLPSPVGVRGRVSHILGSYPREKSRIIVQKIGVVATSPVAKSRRTILLVPILFRWHGIIHLCNDNNLIFPRIFVVLLSSSSSLKFGKQN